MTLKERNRGLNRVLLITNLIMLLFLMFLTHASTLSTLLSPFDCSPFSFDKPHFCPDLSSGEEPASLVDWKDTGETTAPISFLQEDQISQPSDVFDFEKFQTLVCLKLAPSGNKLIFGPILFAPPTLSLTLLLKATEFLSLNCLRIL